MHSNHNGWTCFAGFVYFALSTLVKLRGVLRSNESSACCCGSRIIIIGMGLAPVAVDMALGKNSAYSYSHSVLVSMITLVITLSVAVFAKGMMKLIPIMFGIAAGYVGLFILRIQLISNLF